eukprot:CAMPEP_0174580146 /NCGR_PEP_ID=MMETSP0929-20130131/2020_1 /TAXON_ID=548131 ORGANISM="Ostreococcus mediterraneus, Strain clade-D-RCC2572" /NCGR_SAMPLE_ID=MMETSP0929 /ASSEMBLY_ACC=CAM_ASM_000573 /LENGTH=456 /DNA_ID=CAMNT_0015761569 /DNA_START=367 /DNA_END=1737 /DNA_ORIENTATION=+
MEQARIVDKKRASGEVLHELAGIPLAIKDNICVKTLPTTAGSKMLYGHGSTYDAEVVRSLKECDSILLGKTNMDEFGMGSTSESSASAPTRNPWNIAHVPGGSSGGSAAAVSAQLCVAALGTDTGGSIRQPSAFCGVVGLKPTYGTVSRHGLVAYCSSFDTIGAIASTVQDTAILHEAIRASNKMWRGEYDSSLRQATSRAPILLNASHLESYPLKGRRFAVIAEAIGEGLALGIRECFMKSVKQIENLGGSVDLVSCKTFDLGLPAYYVIALSEASSNLARLDGVRYGGLEELCGDSVGDIRNSRAQALGAEVRRRVLMGTYMLSSGYSDEYYSRAKQAQRAVCNELKNYLRQYDALLTPATADVAYRMGEKILDPLQMYTGDIMTVNVNLAGLPAIVVRSRAGVDHEGVEHLPLGMQFIGPHFGESQLLEIAHAFEVSTISTKFPERDILSSYL